MFSKNDVAIVGLTSILLCIFACALVPSIQAFFIGLSGGAIIGFIGRIIWNSNV